MSRRVDIAPQRWVDHTEGGAGAAWPAFEHSLAMEIPGFAGADAREGMAALSEKRPPRFGA